MREREQMTLTIDKSVLEYLKTVSAKENRTPSNYIETVLKREKEKAEQ